MKRIAYYIRTSHYLQNVAIQKDIIQDHWKVFKDEDVSGTVPFNDRPMGKKLLREIKEGLIDEVIVLRLDRLGRNTEDMLKTIKEFHKYGVGVTSKNEGFSTMIDGKESPFTSFIIKMLSSLSEFEFNTIKEKTLEGIERAKLRGVYKGRKTGAVESYSIFMRKPKVKKILTMLNHNLSIRQICEVVECSPNTVMKVMRRKKEEESKK
jgi:DNA invertase Pin-like site-specific DNA recombinase